MSLLDMAPITIKRGFSGTQMASGNAKSGGAKVENLCANPMDSVSCNSSLDISWGSEKSWMFGKSMAVRELKVQDNDATPNLRLQIHQNGEQSEASIFNGQGPNISEIRFPVGNIHITESDVAKLESLTGSAIHIRYSERLDEVRFIVGEAPYPVSGFAIKQGSELVPASTCYRK
jgi:hypothetical protein